jgi:hypothetical protein
MALKKGNSAIQLAIQMKVKIVITTGKNRRPFFSPAVLMQMLYSASITASTTFWRPDGIRLIFRVASSATTISRTTTVSDVTYVLTSGNGPIRDGLGDLDDFGLRKKRATTSSTSAPSTIARVFGFFKDRSFSFSPRALASG